MLVNEVVWLRVEGGGMYLVLHLAGELGVGGVGCALAVLVGRHGDVVV